MTVTVSIFLDLIRFGAALLVALHHACFTKFGTHLPGQLVKTGTEPVIVFFVLSGVVIAYTADCKDHTLKGYSISRMARIFSVMVPALLVTALLDDVGCRLAPALYADHWTDPHTLDNVAADGWRRYLTTATFTNELWWRDFWPGTDSPFWSLGYEVGYYLLFAIAFYLRGRYRIALLVAVSFILGPKILFLAPVWILGAVTWQALKKGTVGAGLGGVFFVCAIAGYLLFVLRGARAELNGAVAGLLGPVMVEHLSEASLAASNAVTACCFALALLGFAGMQHWFVDYLNPLHDVARRLGGVTFTMYLFHYPLVYFFAALATSIGVAWFQPVIVLGGTAIAIYGLATITEYQKFRWKAALVTLARARSWR